MGRGRGFGRAPYTRNFSSSSLTSGLRYPKRFDYIPCRWIISKLVFLPCFFQSSPPPAEGSRQVVEETACLLGDQAHTEACLAFAREVGVVEDNIRGVGERVSNLRVPREPDLEKVHNGIDHCEV